MGWKFHFVVFFPFCWVQLENLCYMGPRLNACKITSSGLFPVLITRMLCYFFIGSRKPCYAFSIKDIFTALSWLFLRITSQPDLPVRFIKKRANSRWKSLFELSIVLITLSTYGKPSLNMQKKSGQIVLFNTF